MKLSRRQFLHLAAGTAALLATLRSARSQSYPARLVRIIVGFPAGGAVDIAARLIGQCLSKHLGQPFVIENRPGAAGNIATEAVLRAQPDGHTLLLVGAFNAINATLYDRLNFNFIRDIAPVASISRNPLAMLVNPSGPAKSVAELIVYAKGNPGKLNMASAGNGTPQHVAGELFKMLADVDMLRVPYPGSAPAMTALLGGHVDVTFDTLLASLEHIKTGKVRALAVTTASRSDAVPDVPTISDFLPGYEASGWSGIGAPRNTPIEIVLKLNQEINACLTEPAIKSRLAQLGGSAHATSPVEFAKFIADETEKWGKVIRAANIKPD
jgi:tripartite-type tricarboxylate transporter receptor subunit TctC